MRPRGAVDPARERKALIVVAIAGQGTRGTPISVPGVTIVRGLAGRAAFDL
jgi:hypothetical protein